MRYLLNNNEASEETKDTEIKCNNAMHLQFNRKMAAKMGNWKCRHSTPTVVMISDHNKTEISKSQKLSLLFLSGEHFHWTRERFVESFDWMR